MININIQTEINTVCLYDNLSGNKKDVSFVKHYTQYLLHLNSDSLQYHKPLLHFHDNYLILKITIMNFKKITLPLMALALSFTIISCDSEKNEKDEKDEATETNQQEKAETEKNNTTATVATALPAGEITLDRLPASVKEFVTKNHPGYALVKAVSDPLCQGGDAIDVAIAKTGAPNLSLIFKPDGTYVQQEEDVPLTTATAKIKDALKAKYAGYFTGSQIEKVILADKSVEYLVDLTKGNVTKEVIFSVDGIVVCEK